MAKVIDLASIDREQFNVSERGDFFLITPAKSKHVWEEGELHLRSLLVRRNGEVVSSGFPKFRNYGEDRDDDVEFRAALARGEAIHREKLDGSLIIASIIDGEPHLRTRGNHCLGEFEEPVLTLIAQEYPDLFPGLRLCAPDLSVLFEYVAPTNRIVLKYEKPELVLLGTVEHDSLEVNNSPFRLKMFSDRLGVRLPEEYELPDTLEELTALVKAWPDKEGIVADYEDTRYGRRLIKVKATLYCRLHTIRFRLTEPKVNKLCFLLNIRSMAESRRKLYAMGIDFEVQEEIQGLVLNYLNQLQALARKFDYLSKTLDLSAAISRSNATDPREARKDYVAKVGEWLRLREDFSEGWFGAAMMIFDGNHREAWIDIVSRFILSQSTKATKVWLGNPMVEIKALIDAPSVED